MKGLARVGAHARRLGESASVRAVDAALAAVALADSRRELLFSLAITIVFLGPAVFSGGTYAHYLFSGDVLGWYTPTLEKTHQLLSRGAFTALDFSRYNGSSDFWLTPVFFYFHPLVVLYGLFAPADWVNVIDAGFAILLLAAIHVFIATYATLKLLRRHFLTGFGFAALGATLYGVSLHMMHGLFQPSFLLCASMLPWIVLAALDRVVLPSARSLVLAALPIVLCLLGGYLPLAAACMMLAAAFIAAKVLYADAPSTPREGLLRIMPAVTPFLVAILVTLPLLVAVFEFHSAAFTSRAVSIEYAAYDLAEVPHSLLRFFSANLPLKTNFYEFTFTGAPALVLIVLLFVVTPGAAAVLSVAEMRMLVVSVIGYGLTVLSTLGAYSPISDFVFYVIPQVGKMHIYQRFLLPAQLLLALALVLMLKGLLIARPVRALRWSIVGLVLAAGVAAWLVGMDPARAKQMLVNEFLPVELLLGAALASALLFASPVIAVVTAGVALAFTPLDRVYDLSANTGSLGMHMARKVMGLDVNRQNELVRYIKAHFGDRAVVKYVDVTPIWHSQGVETFPKNFPYYVLQKVDLSSYGGTPTHISARRDYAMKMPLEGQGALNPSWSHAEATGADFVVAYEEDLRSGKVSERLAERFAATKPQDLFRLPNNAVIMPLRDSPLGRDALFENGFFRLSPQAGSARTLPNLAKGATATQSSTAGTAEATRVVDGNTNGDFAAGSVSHSGPDPDAWIDVDLGREEQIDSVRIWNRTDCCMNRLRNYWVFVSPKPFGARDKARIVRERGDVWSKRGDRPDPSLLIPVGVKGRYVRIQYDGTLEATEAYLAIAEVEVLGAAPPAERAKAPRDFRVLSFETNMANRARIEFEASGALDLQYLFSPNPRLAFHLDGKRVQAEDIDGLLGLHVAQGRHTVELRYQHRMLALFWLVYAAYMALCVALLLWPFAARWRRRRELS